MENFEQNVVTLTKGGDKFTLINGNGKTQIDCNDPIRDGRMICQSDRAFAAFCNTMVTLLGYEIVSSEKGGVK